MKQWENFLKELDGKLGYETVNKWLRTLKIIKFDAGNLFLDAVDSFQINWFKEQISPFLPKRFVMANGKPIKIHFSIKGKPLFEKPKETISNTEELFAPSPIEPHATFDEYILSEYENLPHDLLRELASGKLASGVYNPIYIYGPKGSGKSHLLMATARSLEESGKHCFYIRADTFTQHVIRAFRGASLQEFRKVCRDIEVLIIDDVHLFSRKTATQEELFHTFNRLHIEKLQIILGSNVAPYLLEEIEQRLVSRFEWGITLPLIPPKEKERRIILEKRADALNFPLNPPLIEFLLTSFKNLHSLIQALQALTLRLPEAKIPPDLEIVKHHLKDLIENENENILTPEKILKVVANSFGIKIEDILGKKQSKEEALPRQIAMYLCRERLRMPFLKIGRFFSRDHSTVMTSVKRVKKGIEKKEEGFLLPLNEIQRILI